MRRFRSYLQLPFEHKKIGKLMEITGIAISPGVYTGIDGATIEYRPEVISQIVDSMPGKTILFQHTKEGSAEEVAAIGIGFFAEAWKQGDSAMYRGYVYRPDVFPLIEDRTLHSGSLELDVKAEYDEARDVYVAKEAYVYGFTLTDRPAVKGATILGHNYVTQVRLEAWPGKSTGGGNVGELDKLDEGYPRPEMTPWGEMSDKEKYQTCVTFFKNKGYPVPEKHEELQNQYNQLKEEFEALVEATGIDLESYRDFMKECLSSGKSMKECAALWRQKKQESPELENLRKRVEYFEKRELERLVSEIKQLDKDFNPKDLLAGLETFDQKKAILEKYKNFLEKNKPKVKLEIGGSEDTKAKLEARRKALAESMLPPDLLSLVFPENQGGK